MTCLICNAMIVMIGISVFLRAWRKITLLSFIPFALQVLM